MANYYIDSKGNVTKKKKENNYVVKSDGTVIAPIRENKTTKTETKAKKEDIAPIKKSSDSVVRIKKEETPVKSKMQKLNDNLYAMNDTKKDLTKRTSELYKFNQNQPIQPITQNKKLTEVKTEKNWFDRVGEGAKKVGNTIAGTAGNLVMGIESTIPKAVKYVDTAKDYAVDKVTSTASKIATNIILGKDNPLNEVVSKTMATTAKGKVDEITDKTSAISGLNNTLNSEKAEKWRKEQIQANTERAKKGGVVGEFANDVALGVGGNVIPMAVTYFSGGLGAGLFMTSAGGSYLEDAEQRGMEGGRALGYATGMGIVEGGTDWLINGKMLNKVAKNLVGKEVFSKATLKSLGLNSLENAIQEGGTEIIGEAGAELASIGTDEEYADWNDIGKRALRSALVGAVSGVIMQGAGNGIGRAVYVSNVQNNTNNAIQTAQEQLGRELTEQEQEQIKAQIKETIAKRMMDTEDLSAEEKAEIEKLSKMSDEDMVTNVVETLVKNKEVDVEEIVSGVEEAIDNNTQQEAQRIMEELNQAREEQQRTDDIRANEIIQDKINALEEELAPLQERLEAKNTEKYAVKIASLEETKEAYKNNDVIVEAIDNQIKQIKQDVKTEVSELTAPAPQNIVEQTGKQDFENITDADAPINEDLITSRDISVSEDTTDVKTRIKDMFGLKKKESVELYDKISKADSVEKTAEILQDYRDITDNVVDDRVKEIRSAIRNTKLDVNSIKGQITDYNDWRKSNFGKLKIGNDGIAVDSFYQELSSMYPDYFDSEVANVADQLEAIADFMANNQAEYTEVIGRIDDAELQQIAEELYTDIHAEEFEKGTDYKKSLKDLDSVVDKGELEAQAKEQEDIELKERVSELTEAIKDLKSQIKEIAPVQKTVEKAVEKAPVKEVKQDTVQETTEKAPQKAFVYKANANDSDIKKAVYESATKTLLDTKEAHKFADIIAKIAEERGTVYRFTNNKQLQELGYAVKGKTVNGLVNDKGEVLLNVNSKKAINRVLGHETTHLLEGTQEYQELQKMAIDFAKANGDYDTRMAELKELYKGRNADIDAELTADLVGDYLFTSEQFVQELSTQKPTIFQKIKAFIDDLVVKFRGTEQEKALRKMQRSFEKAYRNTQTQVSESSVSVANKDNQGRVLTAEQQEYFKDSKVRDENGNLLVMYHGSDEKFTEFDLTKLGKNTGDKIWGIWTTSDVGYASQYASKNLIEGYVEIKKPLSFEGKTIDLKEFTDVILEFAEKINKPILAKPDVIEKIYNKSADDVDLYTTITTAIPKNEWVNFNLEVKNKMGYDGLILENGDNTIAVAFESNQIKNIDNTNPTDNPDIRYSLSDDGSMVDETGEKVTLEASETGTHGTLMAIHNLNDSKLQGILELGGFPFPSIAITNPNKFNHSGFGDISVIFDKNTIDPANKKNKVYSRDAYTPRFPSLEYKTDSNVLRDLRGRINKLGHYAENNYVSSANSFLDNIEDTLNNRGGIEGLIDRAKNDEAFKYLYIKENNIPLTEQYKDEAYSRNVSNDLLQKFLDNYKGDKNTLNELGYDETNALRKDLEQLWIEENFKEPEAKEFLKTHPNYSPDLNYHSLNDIVMGAYKLNKYGKSQILDVSKTNELINDAVNQEEYESWLRNEFKNIIEKKGLRNNKDIFTPSGNRRSFEQLHDEYNLDNVVKIMTALDDTGSESTMFTGLNEIAGDASIRFDSIAEIKAKEDLIQDVSEEKYSKMLEDMSSRLREIENTIIERGHRSSSNPFMALDNLDSSIAEVARKFGENKKVTSATVVKNLNEWGFNPTQEEAQNILDMFSEMRKLPTQYFEAKPKRAVGFDEVQAVVVPNTIDASLKQDLVNRGLNVIEYDPNIENDRQVKINALDDLKFSLSNENENVAPIGDYNIYGKDIALQDNTAPVKTNKNKPTSVQNISNEQVVAPVQNNAQNANTEQMTANIPTANTKQRKWVGTSTESDVVNREILPDDLNQEAIHYEPITNKETLSKANAKLDSIGDYDKAVEYFNNKLLDRKTSVEDIVLGERLIQEAIKKGDTKTAGELIQNVAILGTELGQKIQALSIIQRMTPEGQLKMLEKTVNRAKMKGDKSFENVEITQEMKDKILSLYDENGGYEQLALTEVIEAVKQDIANQMEVTTLDKVNAWRYLAMLGNPKTHIRNLVSNTAMRGTTIVKDAIARTIETVAPVKNRTKTWQPVSKTVNNFANKTTLEMKDIISGDSSYSEETGIKRMRETFKTKILEKAYNFNSKLLEKEDWAFSKGAYKRSLAEYLTANGIRTQEDIDNNPKLVEKAKNYALEQSQIATFRQYSFLANKIREFENKNTATNVAIGSILPFKKTPINIAKTGLNYSPLGFTKTLTYDIAKVKKGDMEASQLVDNLAKNITGTGLMLVGYMLAQSGLINGAGEDDKEGKYDYQLGKQAYSLNIGGNTYSLSWLSPVAMPLFVGANAYNQLVEDEEWDANLVIETLGQTLDPLSEMSFVSSLTDVLSSYESGGMQKLWGMFEAMGQSYVGQFVPTLLSQVASTLDDTKRSTKASADSDFRLVEETARKLAYKIPILRQVLEPTTDIWGNEVKQTENKLVRAYENFIAPYSKKESIATDIDENLREVYKETGENGVLPSVPYSYINYGGEKYKMSAKEHTDFKKTYGQTANSMLEELFNTTTYKDADMTEKAKMIDRVYDYSSDLAKKGYLSKQGVEYTNSTEDGEKVYKEDYIKGAIKKDMTVDDYKEYLKVEEDLTSLNLSDDEIKSYVSTANTLSEISQNYKKLNDKGTDDDDETMSKAKKLEIVNTIKSSGLKDEVKAILYKKEYNSDTIDYIVDADISVDDYLTYETQEFKADYNYKGKAISGSRKNKVINYINSLEMNIPQKAMLIKYTNTFKFNDYNNDIVQYVSDLNLTYDKKKTLLEELDMKVLSDGTVTWE